MQVIVELLASINQGQVVAFLVGILTSEGTRRVAAMALRAWGESLKSKASKTPSKDDDKIAEVADAAADAVADVLERQNKQNKK